MKIFYAAAFDNEGVSSDTSKLRELEALGHTVIAYNYRVRGAMLSHNPLVSVARDDEIITLCKNWAPDFIIFAKCNGIDIRVFEEVKKVAPVCYWFADPYVTYDNPEFFLKTETADFVTCDKKNVYEKSITLNPNTFITPDGYDRLAERPKEVEKQYNVSFIGNLYGDRKEKIEQIAHPVDIINNVYGDEHSVAVSATKINLNFCTSEGPSDRVFKVLGTKGFLITDEWADRPDYFEDGEDLVVFKDFDDLNEKIEFYLKNDTERERIAANGYKKVQQYTRQEWARKTIEVLHNLNIDRSYTKPKQTVLIAGPWIGEFGWELFCWQGHIRSLAKYYDKVICISSKHSSFLYEDFCNLYISFDPEGVGPRDSYHRQGVTLDGRYYQNLLKSLKLDFDKNAITLFPPRKIGGAPMLSLLEKNQLGPHYLAPTYEKLGEAERRDDLVLVHARNRSIRTNDNWGLKNWEDLVDKLSNKGYNVICIGTKGHSLHIPGAEDHRECKGSELMNLFASAKCIIGESSGPMHLASLAGCPQIVWADWHTSAFSPEDNCRRYKDFWNPFKTSVMFLDQHGANPPVDHVYEKFLKWSFDDE